MSNLNNDDEFEEDELEEREKLTEEQIETFRSGLSAEDDDWPVINAADSTALEEFTYRLVQHRCNTLNTPLYFRWKDGGAIKLATQDGLSFRRPCEYGDFREVERDYSYPFSFDCQSTPIVEPLVPYGSQYYTIDTRPPYPYEEIPKPPYPYQLPPQTMFVPNKGSYDTPVVPTRPIADEWQNPEKVPYLENWRTEDAFGFITYRGVPKTAVILNHRYAEKVVRDDCWGLYHHALGMVDEIWAFEAHIPLM